MRTWIALLLNLALAAAARGAELPATAEIVALEVETTGAGQVDPGFVRAHTVVREGMTLDRAELARDVRRLLDTGRFTAVDVDVMTRDRGLAVRYRLKPRLRLAAPVAFTGSDHFSASKLRSFVGLSVGDLVDDQVIGVRARTLRREFREDYFPDPVITWDITVLDAEQGLARVTVDIDDGGRSRVAHVRFEGNAHLERRTLMRAIGRPAWYNPLWLFRPRRYTAAQLEGMRITLRDRYRGEGFLDVRVEPPRVTTDARGRQTVTFTLEEGPFYRFDELDVYGVSAFPRAEVAALIVGARGAPASSADMDATAERIRAFYGSHGYARARVEVRVDTRPADGTANVTYAVREGELIYVGNVRIRGNTKTRDKVIRREILVYPGDVLDSVRAHRSERRLMNLGFFSNVRRYAAPTAVPDREDVIFEVEEKSTGQFLMGAGFSSVDNIIGFVEVSQGNFDLLNWRGWFTGGGQKLKIRAQAGSDRRDYEISFVEPWFLDRQLSLGLDLFRNDISYSDYDLQRTGGGISLSHPLPGPNRVRYGYVLEDTRIRDIADTNEYFYADTGESYFFSNEEDRTKSSLRVTLRHDTRNSPFVPTRGLRVNLFAGLSGGPLGFDTDLYELGGSLAWYIPLWWRHVVSVKLRYEMVDTYGDTDEVPISDRLFAGGGRTVRGYDYRDVGPKVVPADPTATVASYRPVGGQSLAVGNVEYTIPLVEGIRLAGFYDIGSAWRDPFEVNVGTLASSAGAGIRFDLPGFPIRVDRAWSVEKDDPLTQTDDWVIWIGYDY